MAFLIFTEDTLRGQEGVGLALRQTFLWKKPEGAQGPEGIAGSSSVIFPERWGWCPREGWAALHWRYVCCRGSDGLHGESWSP